MFVAAVLIINLCGLYNCIAYTVIRRRLQQQKASRGPQVVLSHGGKAAKQASHVTDVDEKPTTRDTSFEPNQIL